MRRTKRTGSKIGRAILLGAIGVMALSPHGRADIDPHAKQDAFDAEVAKLLPPSEKPIAQATPPAQRSTLGDWSAVIPWTPHIPVSAAQLPDGRLLTFASNQRTTFPSGPEFTYAATWDPATGTFVEYNNASHDMFCGALVMLPDGRVLVNGGRNTTVRSSIFDWRVNTWTRTPDMNDPRWYDTSVALPSGRVFTVSGSGGSGTAERWDNSSGWSRLTGINWNTVLADPGYINIWHPFMLLAPDGRLIHFGPTDTMHWVTADGAGTLSNTGTTVPGSHYPKEGAWVMFNEGRIVVAGGGANTTNNAADTTTGTSTTQAYTVDVRSGTPVVTPASPMQFARQFANAVVLPNGEVMVMGGNTSGLKFDDTGSILTPEIWNPATGTWRAQADESVPRNYHSIALLMPDGRVLSGGGGLGGNAADHRDAQLFTPATLFNADGTPAPRPTLAAAPQSIGVGTTFSVAGTAGIQRFSFIKMSAITHCVNTDVRFLSLPFTEVSPGSYQVTAHNSLNVMTPGYWMLFGLNAAGAHSVAKIILVDAINSVAIAAPGNQASYVTQPASLQMVASAPSGSVLKWSATGLPTGLSINQSSGLISGTATAQGTFSVSVSVTDNITSDIKNFTWTIQPLTFSQNFANFTGASGLTMNGNAVLFGSVLRLASNVANQVGSAYLTTPKTIGPNTSLSTRFVFRISGSADGADGMTFVIQGVGPNALGAAGGGLGYDGVGSSVAVEIDNYQGATDPNANHFGILVNGNVQTHVATAIPTWDLEDGNAHTVWVEYDGPANLLSVYAAQGNVAQRPGTPLMTANIDLPATVGGQAWFGFSAGTGGQFNNHDVEAWSLSLNALALPAPPVITVPGNQVTVLNAAVNLQMQASDPNGDLLAWSATGLPTGLAISPTTGLITGTPTSAGTFSPTVSATDNNTPPSSVGFTWTINPFLIAQPISGVAVAAGSSVALSAQSSGGLNPQYQWSFGDGAPDSAPSSSPNVSHVFSAPGRYLVTVTVQDDTGRVVTSSYRQAVFAPATTGKPTASSSIIYEKRTGQNSRVWAVNPDNDSVTVFDAVTRAKLAEVNVGKAPRTLALAADGRVWVANAEGASITILRPDYTVAQTAPLPRGSRPFGVVFNPLGTAAYVALEALGEVLQLDPSTGSTLDSVDVGPNVRHLSVTADGALILATRFVTPPVPGEETASPQTTVGGVKYGGEVLKIDAAAFSVAGTIVLEHSEQPDTSNSAKGIPNYVGASVISPDGLTAWAPSKQDNIKRGALRSNSPLTHDMAMRSVVSKIVMATQTEDTASRVDFDDGGIASAAAFDPNGVFLFTALEGSREVAVVDVWGGREFLRFSAGRAPQGLVVSPDGRTLFVQNFMDRTITVHDLTGLANGSEAAPAAPVTLNCVTTEKLSATVLQGKKLFYDTRDNRIALQQYISCAGCHNDGGQDGRTWDFTQFGEGLRNTITLRGHGGMAEGPLHWSGNFDEVQDFEGQIRNFAGGVGLMSDVDFHTGTRSDPMGLPKAGLSADLDALAAYVSSLTAQGDSPDRNADGSMTAEALAGQLVFQQANCAQCHAGAKFTDSAIGLFHDIGTLKPSSGGRLGAPLTGLDTPTLLGLWATAPYLHDGSAPTLDAAVQAHGGVTVSGEDLSNLVAFLRQIDNTGVTSPAAVITWSNPADIIYGTALSAAQLNATANVPGTFAYTPAIGTVLTAGNAQTLLVTFTPADLTANSPAGASVSINVLKAALTITAAAKSKVYGAAMPALTASYSGFVNGDTAANLDSAVVLNTGASASSPVGNYAITASGASDGNYTIAFVNGSLAVTRAALTIRADDKTKVAGQANPALSATYTGLVNGDTAASLDTAVTLATTAVAGSPAGSYPITASGAADANYTITHVNGTLTVTPTTALPSPWTQQDLGSVGVAGGGTYSGGVFTVGGSGADIWNNADAFHFVYQPWTGNGEIIARVTAVGNTDPWAKAGVMFRQALTAGSPHAFMSITPGNGAAFQRRIAQDGVSTHTAGAVVTAPYWVRLARSGNTFTGYSSPDGVAWTQVGTETFTMASTIYVGLAVTAHNNTALCTSTFASVSVTAPVAPPTVAITAPANGATFTASANITINASVTANGNTITKVQFLRSGTLLGEDTTSPYSFAWNGVAVGTYSLVARAVYGTGATVDSTAVSVTVGAPPGAPTGLTATAVSASQINLAWKAGSGTTSGYRIERSPNGTSSFAQIAATAAGTITYSNTGLGAGTAYYYRVIGTNSFGASASSSVANATTPSVIRVNFQPATAPVPSGYLVDSGAVYGARGNGQTYGWNADNSVNARDRNSSLSADQRYDTLTQMQKSPGGTRWEIAVPNGSYSVTIVAGDASNFDSVFRINAETTLVVSGTPTSANRWVSGTKTVKVSDGRLTISNGSGASNNKLCFIDITPVAAAAPLDIIARVEPQLHVDWDPMIGALKGWLENPSALDTVIESSDDLVNWMPVAVNLDVDNTFVIDVAEANQKFYRATAK